jgi:hypothetical protein
MTAMTGASDEHSADFRRGWDAALLAARAWHEAQARQAVVQSRRTRFPKALEREAEVHRHSAEMMATLSPDDV